MGSSHKQPRLLRTTVVLHPPALYGFALMSDKSGPTILCATELVVRHNDRYVLDHASLSIHDGDRIGLVGRNGSGKSTFLKIIAKELVPDGGEVTQKKDLIVGYLPQTFTLDENLNVLDNVRAGAQRVLDLIAEFESLPAHSNRHEEIEEHIQRMDGWNLDNHIETAMAKLNCPAPDRDIKTLSGGSGGWPSLVHSSRSRIC
jgi:ABC transport system ATP-binding/permease protein